MDWLYLFGSSLYYFYSNIKRSDQNHKQNYVQSLIFCSNLATKHHFSASGGTSVLIITQKGVIFRIVDQEVSLDLQETRDVKGISEQLLIRCSLEIPLQSLQETTYPLT